MRSLFSLTGYTTISIRRIAVPLIALVALLIQAPAFSEESDHQKIQTGTQTTMGKKHIGDTTTSILQSQANGSMAGAPLPILGPTATLSWQRYLDSYKHPIPETFTRKLDELGQR